VQLAISALKQDVQAIAGSPILALEILRPVFYRNKAAYIVGRIRTDGRIIPFTMALVHDDKGIRIDAVLTDEADVSNVFTYTRSNFRVDVRDYRGLIRFLQSILPHKGKPALYSAIGFVHPARIELIKDLRKHLEQTGERFEKAEGTEGRVMMVFQAPTHPYVFKIVMDESIKETFQGRDHVFGQYQKVHEIDRVGRMLDSHVYRNLRVHKSLFPEEYLQSMLRDASSSVVLEGDEVVLKRVYVQRRVTPLNIFLERTKDPEELRKVVIDFGYCIKDLAAAGLFAADIFTKNFGVTQHGRVVLYDYDDLEELAPLQFGYKKSYMKVSIMDRLDVLFDELGAIERAEGMDADALEKAKASFIQKVKDLAETRGSRAVVNDLPSATAELRSIFQDAYQDSMTPDIDIVVPPGMYLLDEISYFLGLPQGLKDIFNQEHADIWSVGFWKGVQERLQKGEVLDFYPYPLSLRLVNRRMMRRLNSR
jgi:isocitrate dehydrogenase kinase/phosphatase